MTSRTNWDNRTRWNCSFEMPILTRELKQRWANDELPVDLHEEWKRHMNAYPLRFPRDVGLFPKRWSVDSEEEFLETIDRHLTAYNCYTNVYSRPMIEGEVFDTFYVDIDADVPWDVDDDEEEKVGAFREMMRDAYFDIQKLVYYMDEMYDSEPRVYFSGGRGFSVYFDFPPRNVPFGAAEATVEEILGRADVDADIIDSSVHESNRLSRLPYTLNWNNHEKRGFEPLLVLPIDPDWDKETFIDEILDPEKFLHVRRRPSEELADAIEGRSIEGEYERREYDTTHEADPEDAWDKVTFLMDKADEIDDGRHRILFAILVPALVESGFRTSENIHEYCEEFIERTGKTYPGSDYERYVDRLIDRTIRGPRNADGTWSSWSIRKFLVTNDDLIRYFV